MRALITGAAGAIGTTLVGGLAERHQLRLFDREPVPGHADAHIGDVGDMDTCLQITRDMEAVIHLAGHPGDRPWPELAHSNYQGTYNIFEACRLNNVPRIAFASRAGLLGPYPKSLQRTVDMLPRPEGLYSISKVFGESLGYMYAARHGLEVVCVRIGNFKRDRDLPLHPHHLSHGDCVRVFERAITHPGVHFEVVFGVSASNWPLYDLEHGKRAIGYEPQDVSHVPEQEWEQ